MNEGRVVDIALGICLRLLPWNTNLGLHLFLFLGLSLFGDQRGRGHRDTFKAGNREAQKKAQRLQTNV